MRNAPRRLDVDELQDGLGLRVFVSGERQTLVRFYDIDNGFIERIKTDGRGRIVSINGEAIIETVVGKVQVELWKLAHA